MKYALLLAMAGLAVTASARAAPANQITFYPKLDCDSGRVFPYSVDSRSRLTLNCTYGHTCQNDQYRSVRIGPKVPPGTLIKLYDDSKGSSKDDWAFITVKQIPANAKSTDPDQPGLCIPTLEMGVENKAYKLYYHRVDNLNGHVSLIEVIPGTPTSERTVATPAVDPAPVKPVLISKKRGTLSADQARALKKR